MKHPDEIKAELIAAAELAVLRGCVCRPEFWVDLRGGLDEIYVAHDEGCPAVTGGVTSPN